MKFKSPTEEPIYIGLTTGHTCTIGPEYVEVDPRFQREAVAMGAIPEGFEAAQAPKPVPQAGKSELIVEAMRKLVAEAKPADFAGDGKPKVPAVSDAVGFTVSREERDAAWAILSQDE